MSGYRTVRVYMPTRATEMRLVFESFIAGVPCPEQLIQG